MEKALSKTFVDTTVKASHFSFHGHFPQGAAVIGEVGLVPFNFTIGFMIYIYIYYIYIHTV